MQPALKEFSYSEIVNLPREQVVDLFFDLEVLKQYQDFFSHMKIVRGDYLRQGSISNLHFGPPKGSYVVKQTIRKNRLPDLLESECHSKDADMEVTSRFIDRLDGTTECKFFVRVLRTRGFFMRLIMRFFPNFLSKKSQDELRKFKIYVESVYCK